MGWTYTRSVIHDLWRAERASEGWRYGEAKDADRKTNPLLVEYARLTDEQ